MREGEGEGVGGRKQRIERDKKRKREEVRRGQGRNMEANRESEVTIEKGDVGGICGTRLRLHTRPSTCLSSNREV